MFEIQQKLLANQTQQQSTTSVTGSNDTNLSLQQPQPSSVTSSEQADVVNIIQQQHNITSNNKPKRDLDDNDITDISQYDNDAQSQHSLPHTAPSIVSTTHEPIQHKSHTVSTQPQISIPKTQPLSIKSQPPLPISTITPNTLKQHNKLKPKLDILRKPLRRISISHHASRHHSTSHTQPTTGTTTPTTTQQQQTDITQLEKKLQQMFEIQHKLLNQTTTNIQHQLQIKSHVTVRVQVNR